MAYAYAGTALERALRAGYAWPAASPVPRRKDPWSEETPPRPRRFGVLVGALRGIFGGTRA